MRSIFSFICTLYLISVLGQSVSSTEQDFGKVKLWNNPVFEAVYTNTSGRTQLFLPIMYQPDIKVNFEKSKLASGESTVIKMQYYTEEFGRFSKDVSVYISTQNSPLIFTLKGNIQSFHPDAFSFCPRIENSDEQENNGFIHTITVIDAITKEPLTGYEIEIITKYSKETMLGEKSSLNIKREKPDFYRFKVDKENYEIATREFYIQRNSKETIIELVREEEEEGEHFDFNNQVEEQEEVVAKVPELKEPKTKEPLVVIKEIEEEDDVEEELVIDEPKKENIPVEDKVSVVPPPTDTADFSDDGKLNSKKYTYNNIVFLIDVSTSMRNEDKLPLLKHSMNQMIKVLRPEDLVSIITYSTEAKVIVEHISGDRKEYLVEVIEALAARGHSYGKEGVDMAYSTAKEHFIENGNNEIVLASDGVFNSKNFSEKKMYRKAMLQYTAYDVRISTIGFGNTSKALRFLETLAVRGKGSYIKIKTKEEANTMLIANMMKHSAR